MDQTLSAEYWEGRYRKGYLGWDLGRISGPMKHIIEHLKNQDLKILIPGAGNGFEVEYLWRKDFKNIYLLDWALSPLEEFAKRNPLFPKDQLINMDFFQLEGSFDLILEQTFLCSLHPSKRSEYVKKMHELLAPRGILTGVFFGVPMYDNRPPYGGSQKEYEKLFAEYFDLEMMGPCFHSEPGREELEFRMVRKLTETVQILPIDLF